MPNPPKTPVSMPLSTPSEMLSGMAPVRKRLIVEGHVQGVGYRALVTMYARKLKIKGFVRNLTDETVEIVCEGEPEALTSFVKTIDVKGNPADPFTLNVASIKETLAASEGELARFYTDYCRVLTDVERESFDRDEIMVLRAGTLNTNVAVVGQKVDSMHMDMNTRFDHMAERYDMIAISLKDAIVHMDRNAEKTDRAIEKSRKESAAESVRTRKEIAKSHRETTQELSRSRKDVAASNRELAQAVKFMIRKLSDKPTRKRSVGKRKR